MNNTRHIFIFLALLVGLGQAYAHTGVRDVAPEGTASYNGFTITHGCGGDSGKPYPVIGQSAVYPFGADVVWRNGDGSILQEGGDGNGTIVTSTGTPAGSLSLSPTAYSGFQSPFTTTQEIVDDLGNVRGILWKDGAMEPKLNAVTPFRVSAPRIGPAVVKCLKIRIGVINYCDTGKNEANDAKGPWKAPKDAFGRAIPDLTDEAGGGQSNVNGSPVYKNLAAGNDDNNRADWWFTAPYGGSDYYQDIDLLQPEFWTTLTVLNTDAGAVLADCDVAASTVSVEPNGAAFDAILSPANTKPFSKGNGPQ